MTSSLEVSDQEAEAIAKVPANRVRLSDIEGDLTFEASFTLYDALTLIHGPDGPPVPESLKVMTVCTVIDRNGYVVVGTSACADPANFNAEFGAKLAREDCIRQIWPLKAFALKEVWANPG